MSRKWVFILCVFVLSVGLTGCASRKPSSPAGERSILPETLSPPTQPALPVPTSEPTNTSVATGVPEIPAPPPVTETLLAVVTPTPAGPVYPQLQPGQVITITWIHMLDTVSGWAIGGSGQGSDHVLTTVDSGQTWRDVTPPETAPIDGSLSAIGFFADRDAAWVIYRSQDHMVTPDTPVVWRTQDGGLSWLSSTALNLQDLNEFYWPSDLVFADSQHGWLLMHVGVGMGHDYVVLFRTNDGGKTWDRLLDPYGDSGIQACQKTGITFPSSQIGWLTGNCDGLMTGAFLFQTTDGGSTWQPVVLPAPADAPHLLSATDSLCGTHSPLFTTLETGKLIVHCTDYTQDPVTEHVYLYSTRDGGETWDSNPSPAGRLSFAAGESGWVLGRDLYHTTDGAQTWAKVKTVNWDGQFSFVNELLGWAVARSETDAGTLIALVQTTDGGKNWFEIHPVIVP